MPAAVPYARRGYSPQSGRLSDLILEQGRIASERERRSGEIASQAWSGVGQAVGGALSDIVKHQQDAPRREAERLSLDAARDEAATRRTSAESASILRSAQSSSLDPEQVKAQLQQLGRGDLIPIYEKASNDLQASRLALQKSKDERAAFEADYFGGLAAAIKASNYDQLAIDWALSEAEADGHDTAELRQRIQQQPESIQAIVDGLIERSPAQKKLATEATDKATDNARQATAQAETARHNAALEEIQRQTNITAAERANRVQDETERHNKAMEANARRVGEPLEAVVDPKTGQSVLMRRSVAEGMRPATSREQPTEDERKVAGFYARASDAVKTIDELEAKLTQQELYQIQTLPQEELLGMANRNLLGENAKRYLRAFEQLTEARLRADSGAAISDGEYARDRRTFGKQYGETPKLAEDRKRARGVAIDSLRTRAGRALPKTSGPAEGTRGAVNGVPATWKNGPQGVGWYED